MSCAVGLIPRLELEPHPRLVGSDGRVDQRSLSDGREDVSEESVDSKDAKRWEIYGFDWGRIQGLLQSELRAIARVRELVSYSQLVARVGHFDGPDSHALAEMLGEINGIEPPYDREPLLLSAVVTHKDDKYSGKGFFSAASYLGMAVSTDDDEQRIFWVHQLERVHKAYGRGGDR